jgi:predicted pyridoxine 5'-phosphate oxidase superfamily flavin-nucleotide-binding protein
MDYASRSRIKIWGRARVVKDDAALLRQLVDPQYKGHPESAIVFTLEAWDANCPQHITPRYTEDEVDAAVESLRERIAALEAENRALRDAAQASLLVSEGER